MARYKLVLAYDGTQYGGWQIQPNTVTIQDILQRVFGQILQEEIWVTGSGRTDAGVHALEQVAHFDSEKLSDSTKTLISLNALLPPDIRVLSLEPCDSSFHARYSAKGKIYHYNLNLEIRDPFTRFYSTYYPFQVNLQLIQKAARKFVGTHDFTSFANEASAGSAAKNPVRTLYRLDMVPLEHGIRFEFEGNGFLYKMVRNIMGTMLEIGSGRRPLEDIDRLFEIKDRRQAGKTAPPQGLFLVRVHYDKNDSNVW